MTHGSNGRLMLTFTDQQPTTAYETQQMSNLSVFHRNLSIEHALSVL